MDSLYVPQLSPMAALSAMYNGSRSIRGGTWRALDGFAILGAVALIDLGGNIGVVEMAGRLRAAGSMSMLGIVKVAPKAGVEARLASYQDPMQSTLLRNARDGEWRCFEIFWRCDRWLNFKL